MKNLVLRSLKSGFTLRQGAIALFLSMPLLLTLGLPAHAGFLEILRGILTGDTSGNAQGNARGAAIRDRRCGTEAFMTNPAGQRNPIQPANLSTDSREQLILLVPNTGQTLMTTGPRPEVFVYIPPSSGAREQAHSLIPRPMTIGHHRKIDINDIDSVVEEGVQEQLEQTQTAELLLEFQFGGTTSYYSLPNEALIAKIQVSENTPFEIGTTSTLAVRLVCRRVNVSSLSSTAEATSDYTTEAEVFVEVQRVAVSDKLAAAMETHRANEAYRAYLENGLWFEMVASLAANPNSQEWGTLLEELEIPDVNPTPQYLAPSTN